MMINNYCVEISVIMITRLTKIWGINYKGGREFHNLIEEGEKENL